jgi:hypothetical protein
MSNKNSTPESPSILGADLFVNQNPQALAIFAKEFCQNRRVIEKVFNVTPLVVGVNNLSNEPILAYFITCYIVWQTNEKEWAEYVESKKKAPLQIIKP